MANAQDQQAGAKGRFAWIALAGAIVLLSTIGIGGGWLVGGFLAPQIAAVEKAAKADAKAEDEAEKAGEKTVRPRVVALDPITTNLSYPSDNWVRVEVSLVFRGEVDMELADTISHDILAYLRTVSLQQIEGSRGFQYLRQDLIERAKLRSEGSVSNIIFRTFLIE